jgi:GAF domain-containing protein
VAGERRLRILGLLVDAPGEDPGPRRLCEVSAEVTGLNGAGISVMAGDVNQGSLGASDEVSRVIEEMQFALGEGPCLDAHRDDRPVLEPDLLDPARLRWPAFSPPVLDAGGRAVFAFPLRLGAVRIGALDLYRDHPGRLTDEQHADALVVADVVAEAVLMMQADAPPGLLAATLVDGADLHPVVHQATGMVAVQLGVEVSEALVRLKAAAFGDGRALDDVAREVLARTLRFDDDPAPGTNGER